MTPAPNRRWFRFSIRSVLLLMVVAGIGTAVAVHLETARRQRERDAAGQKVLDDYYRSLGFFDGAPESAKKRMRVGR
jgi:hypothetical protein